MCKHCANLTEDKRVVHDFFAVAAARLSEKHGYAVSPDDIEARLVLTTRPCGCPTEGADRIRLRTFQLLADIAKEGW